MDYLQRFDIPFSGLSLGKHQFEFEIEDKFFEHFEHSVIDRGQLKVNIVLEKQTQMLLFDISIKGTLQLICDRCAGEFDQPVDLKEHLIVKFGEVDSEEDLDIVVIPHTATKYNAAQVLYEYIGTEKPMRCVHPDDTNGKPTCDEKVLKLLNKLNTPKKSTKEVDHRWDELLKLKSEGLN